LAILVSKFKIFYVVLEAIILLLGLLQFGGNDRTTSPPALSAEAKELLNVFQLVFQDLPPGLPPLRGTPLCINTGDSHCGHPVFSKQTGGVGFSHAPKEREEAGSQIKDYVEKG
jgi:hypothetical protein